MGFTCAYEVCLFFQVVYVVPVPMESVLPTGVVGTCGYKVCLLMLERVLQETAALLPISVGGACASRNSSSKWQRLCLCL